MSRTIVGELIDGVKIGTTIETAFELRTLSGLEYINCLENSEKLVAIPQTDNKGNLIGNEPTFVSSPAMMTLNVMKMRTKRIGSIPAPIPDNIWALLTDRDINQLLSKSDELDEALSEVAQRGRSETPGAGDASGG